MAIIKRIDYYGIAFVLSISLIIATFLGGRSLERMRSAGNDINVKSVAEKRITSNLASWRGQITLMDKNLANGYDRLQKQYQNSVDYLKIKGIRDKNIEEGTINEGTINTSTKYLRDEKGHTTTNIDTFMLSKSFTVETSDVHLAKRLAKSQQSSFAKA